METEKPLSPHPIHEDSALKSIIIGVVQKLVVAEIFILAPGLLAASWIVSPILNFIVGKLLNAIYIVAARFIDFSTIDIKVNQEVGAYADAVVLIKAAQVSVNEEELRKANEAFDSSLRDLINIRRSK